MKAITRNHLRSTSAALFVLLGCLATPPAPAQSPLTVTQAEAALAQAKAQAKEDLKSVPDCRSLSGLERSTCNHESAAQVSAINKRIADAQKAVYRAQAEEAAQAKQSQLPPATPSNTPTPNTQTPNTQTPKPASASTPARTPSAPPATAQGESSYPADPIDPTLIPAIETFLALPEMADALTYVPGSMTMTALVHYPNKPTYQRATVYFQSIQKWDQRQVKTGRNVELHNGQPYCLLFETGGVNREVYYYCKPVYQSAELARIA